MVAILMVIVAGMAIKQMDEFLEDRGERRQDE